MRWTRYWLSAAAALALVSCSGDGSDNDTPDPPRITSAAEASTPENTSGAVYTVTGEGPSPLTFSLSGGADAALFSFNAVTRQLSFATAPNFELPADANGDNAYEVRFTATDGSLSVSQNVRILVTNVGGAVQARRVASGLNRPVSINAWPDDPNLIVIAEITGRVRLYNPATGSFAPFDLLNLSSIINTNNEQGLLNIAFPPDWACNREIYVSMSNISGDSEIRRYPLAANAGQAAPPAATSGDIILTQDQPAADNHKGGMFKFAPLRSGQPAPCAGPGRVGELVIGFGDGGSTPAASQDPNTLLGKLLRIGVSGDDFPADSARDYVIPPGNPFAAGGGAPEIIAMGLRNPWRGDVAGPAPGYALIGDVGQDSREEINKVSFGETSIVNFGWNLREGTLSYQGGADSPNFRAPVAEYAHGSGPRQGNSITGGLAYYGPIEGLDGQFLFADFVSNNIWTVPLSALSVGTTTSSADFAVRTAEFTPDAGTMSLIVGFGTDGAGNVYVATISGSVFRVTALN